MNLSSTIFILAGGPGSGRHKELIDKIKSKPKGHTNVKEFFKLASKSDIKKLENSKWGNEGFDESLVGKLKTLTTDDLKKIKISDYDFQKDVTNSGVKHYLDKGVNYKKGPDGQETPPVRIVEWNNKYYIHDGRHRTIAALLTGSNLKAYVWKLKSSDFSKKYSYD
jgi:hypothetical protein